MTHHKNQNSSLHLLIHCISSKSAPQILSLKGDHTSRFSNFLIISLWNSSANFWFDIISILVSDISRVAKVSVRAHVTAPLEDFLLKKL